MYQPLFIATTTAYVTASFSYAALLIRGRSRASRLATAALSSAFVLHLIYATGTAFRMDQGGASGIAMSLSVASLLVVVAYLLTSVRLGLEVLGVFITPLSLVFFLGAGLPYQQGGAGSAMASVLLPVHIALNILGVAAFGLASTIALAYVIQERLLKRKRLGGLFQRLPSLDVLDALGLRMVAVGFPLLTLGIATGLMSLGQASQPDLRPSQLLAFLVWAIFAVGLALRHVAGWRGRRAAVGTIAGFLCAMVVLFSYLLRARAVE